MKKAEIIIYKEGELQPDSVVKEYLNTASDGKKYKTRFYSLDVIKGIKKHLAFSH